MHNDWLQPEWQAAPTVGALMTTRSGGVSMAPFDTMNLGLRVGDDAAAVARNRQTLAKVMGVEPVFLHQVHGTQVVCLDARPAQPEHRMLDRMEADAAFTTSAHVACVVQVADCLPVLLTHRSGIVVAAAHAGWRGLAGGILERTVQAMCQAVSCAPQDLWAWLGPCIGPKAFEVGADVLEAFPAHGRHFQEAPRPDGAMRWLADLPSIAADRLRSAGVLSLEMSGACTVAEPHRFYSFRRDRSTGRHAAAIWRRG